MSPEVHRIGWFVPDRPVEGATVYVVPAPVDTESDEASSVGDGDQ
jgi:hypothetical protein